MAEKILYIRSPQKVDTTDNWNNSSLVLYDGEIGIEELEDGSKKFKFGDGENLWKNLPYATGDSLNNILDGIANGSIRTSLSTQESVDYKLGTAAFAEGQGTKANGNFSHAEGFNTTASGAYSHAEGRQTTASGSVSHAEGTDTIASGIRSHAGGYGTIAKGENQMAIGKYNIQDDNNEYAFIIGNGTSSSARLNLFTIDWSGNLKSNGKLIATQEYVGQNGGKIDVIKVNGISVDIKNKAVDIAVPTKTSDLNNDSGFITQHQDISELANLNQVVRHDTAQVLTDEQKELARTNIGAGTSNFDGKYSSLTGIPTIPTKTSQLQNDSGFLTEHQDISGLAPKATTLSGYGITDAYTKTATDTKIQTEIEKLNKADTAVVGKYISSVSEVNGIISVTRDNLPTGIDYTVEITESNPEGYAKAYTITQTATGLNTTINIPKDMVVESGIVETKTESGPWGLAGTYLVLTLANATSDRIYIDVSTLIEYVTSGSTTSDSVQITISSDHKVTATIKDGSITKNKLESSIVTSLGKADTALQSVPNATTSNYGLVKIYTEESGGENDVVTYGFYQIATEALQTELNKKVSAEEGKGLSTNDYTTVEKNKLAGIAAGAEVNVQSNWNQTDSTADDYIKNKPTIPTIPTKVSAFENDAGYLTSHQSLANYVTLNGAQTISGAKTFSAALKALAGLSVTGNITATGTITGSKVYNAVWNDYAEWFEKEDLTENFETGDICIWNKKGVIKAKQLNDKRTIGVVSDSYGHILGGENLENMEDNKEKFVPIGLKGRVKCKVIGPVEIGDLITTSNLEGIGIVDNNCPISSIVGKALESDYTVSVKTITILV